LLRLNYSKKTNDAAGCRAMAEIVEKVKPTDPMILYNLACMRAITAAVIRASDTSETARQGRRRGG